MESEQIKTILEKEGITSEITCPQAFAISERYGVSKLDIATYCNSNNVKIRGCQLGCFK